jgi:hypothetical protein
MDDPKAATSGQLAEKATISLIAASKVKGTLVFNTSGEPLGSIHDLMLDKHSGQVKYALMSFGGFLGVGEQFHPLPWAELRYSAQFGGYVANLDKSRLRDAPVFDAAETPDWSSASYYNSIDSYYGATIFAPGG